MTMIGFIKKMARDAKFLKTADGRVLKSFIGVVTKNRKNKTARCVWLASVLFRSFHSKTLKGFNSPIGEAIKIKGKNVLKFKLCKTLRNKVHAIIVYQDNLSS